MTTTNNIVTRDMQNLHLLGYGILLGLGAAMPVGPVNLEIVRRNLRFGTTSGMLLGLGAACTDLTYLLLLSLGALTLLTHHTVLNVIGLIGAFILAWFGIEALRTKITEDPSKNDKPIKRKAQWRHWLEGYLMTLLNPMTILFWASVSSQVALQAHNNHPAIAFMGAGVIIGAYGWVVSINTTLHFTRHRFSQKVMQRINWAGGIILIGFAIYGLTHTLLHL
ncbi:MAG: LysE family translocator [Coxiellaceae bacterium]|nr:LysE family translocator [Coxiellaceae bacterium]